MVSSITASRHRLMEINIVVAYLLVMFKSMNLYFTWFIPSLLIYAYAFVVSVLLVFCRWRKIRYVAKEQLISGVLLMVILFYDIVFRVPMTFISQLCAVLSLVISVILIFAEKDIKQKILDTYIKVLKWLVGISLFFWILFLLGAPLPHYYSDTSVFYQHTVYYFFLLNGQPGFQIVPRFAGLFLEPGHVGTTCCFALFIERFNLKKSSSWIFLIAILLSFSLAAYGLLIGSLLLYLITKRKGIMYVGLSLFLFGIVVFVSININRGDNLLNNYIFSRLEIVDGGLAGNNRTSTVLENTYRRYIETDEKWFGAGRSVYESNSDVNLLVGSAGTKRFIYLYGIVGLSLVLLFFVFYALSSKSILSLSFLIVFIVANMIRDYPLKELWLYTYILSVPLFKER